VSRPRVIDIAVQAGLSRATVDRVVHGRPGVRPETVAQVEQAVAEIERQRHQVHLSGHSIMLDLVMQAPDRFASACRRALESELPGFRPAAVRVRSHLRETSRADAAADALDAAVRHGSDGVILKAPDDPVVIEAIGRAVASGIPVVTFVTDVPGSRRAAYAGADNRGAGATAAYLVAGWGDATGDVLVTLSSASFRGEEERAAAFRDSLTAHAPHRQVVEVDDTDGTERDPLAVVRAALRRHPGIDGVYSPGGGNLVTLAAFAECGRTPRVFVAHDLDADNRALLRSRRVTAVLHHDLRADLRRAGRLLLQARGVLAGSPLTVPSQVQVVTPYNEPPGLRLDDEPDLFGGGQSPL
jgi:LacI family transcriptional regulator